MNAVITRDDPQTVNRQEPSTLAPAPDAQSFWEDAADTRWGKYVTAIERQALLATLNKFAAPGVGLELGCEGGRWCRFLDDLGWKMTGTDVDPVTLELCRQRNKSVRCILVGEQDSELPADRESIDLLVCLEVPVVESAWFPAEAKRVLKPGGRFVGSFLNLHSWRGVMANMKSTVLGRPKYYSMSYAAFRRSLRNHGFTVDYESGCCWPAFGRQSNSRWIPVATGAERILQLNRLPSISPWIVYTATRG
jgi:SAM-dependent methyltransferase